jgi:hypothetical protein
MTRLRRAVASIAIVWIVAFAVQATDLLTVIAPDTCTEEASGSAGDPCPQGCARCVCCARVPASVPQDATPVAEQFARTESLPPLDPATTPSPRGIYHVPKNS